VSLCPVKALARLCHHIRLHGGDPHTPIFAYVDSTGLWRHITPYMMTDALRQSASALAHITGIAPALISTRSLRPGGATALLCAGVDTDVIQLLGRWKSDAMLRYLRVAAHAHTTNLAQRMLNSGAYTFATGSCTVTHVRPIPDQAPQAFLDAITREALYHA
jgi:hypothetical protein